MADKKFNLNTAFDRGFERGLTEGNNPNIDLLHFGLQDQHHEVLGDLYIADDADFILSLEDEFVEGYLEGCEKYEAPDLWANLPEGGHCFVLFQMPNSVKYFGPFATTFGARDWVNEQPKDVARNMSIAPFCRTDLVRTSDEYWRDGLANDESELW